MSRATNLMCNWKQKSTGRVWPFFRQWPYQTFTDFVPIFTCWLYVCIYNNIFYSTRLLLIYYLGLKFQISGFSHFLFRWILEISFLIKCELNILLWSLSPGMSSCYIRTASSYKSLYLQKYIYFLRFVLRLFGLNHVVQKCG